MSYNTGRRTIEDRMEALEDHFHTPSLVFPTLAPGIVVPDGVAPWTDTVAPVPIVAVGVIAGFFDVHYLNIEAVTASDVYEVALWNSVPAEIGRVRFPAMVGPPFAESPPARKIHTLVQIPGEAIGATLASSIGGNAITLSMFYHLYT